MALGGKTSRDMIRQGADYAYVELVFSVDDPVKRKRLEELDLDLPEDGTIIISKKIMPTRSLSKINDETVTTGRLKEITSLLIDIHGQHEHQSLLYKPSIFRYWMPMPVPDPAIKREDLCELPSVSGGLKGVGGDEPGSGEPVERGGFPAL